jgi:thiaminase/transcriptional activator TenA
LDEVGSPVSFSADAWSRSQTWFDAIMQHPFVGGLASGDLERDVFARYLVDDAHYLERFARALSTVSARWPTAQGLAEIARFGAGAIDAERQLHEDWLGRAGVDVTDLDAIAEPTPTCVAYANTLQARASLESVEVALAALLPCFRVYTEVGTRLAPHSDGRPRHPYRQWLATYNDPAFAAATRRAEELADSVAHERVLGAMHTAYAESVRFEWMFWDASWRGERWPDPQR